MTCDVVHLRLMLADEPVGSDVGLASLLPLQLAADGEDDHRRLRANAGEGADR